MSALDIQLPPNPQEKKYQVRDKNGSLDYSMYLNDLRVWQLRTNATINTFAQSVNASAGKFIANEQPTKLPELFTSGSSVQDLANVMCYVLNALKDKNIIPAKKGS